METSSGPQPCDVLIPRRTARECTRGRPLPVGVCDALIRRVRLPEAPSDRTQGPRGSGVRGETKLHDRRGSDRKDRGVVSGSRIHLPGHERRGNPVYVSRGGGRNGAPGRGAAGVGTVAGRHGGPGPRRASGLRTHLPKRTSGGHCARTPLPSDVVRQSGRLPGANCIDPA